MRAHQTEDFWRSSPPAAKWALAGGTFLAAVAIVPFVILTITVSIAERVSPMTAVFGPLPGNPLVDWLYYTLPGVAIQLAAALALRHPLSGVRAAGLTGVLVLTTAALMWLGAMVYLIVRWLVSGALAGDESDMLGMAILGVPVLTVIVILNSRAALLAVRDTFSQDAMPNAT